MNSDAYLLEYMQPQLRVRILRCMEYATRTAKQTALSTTCTFLPALNAPPPTPAYIHTRAHTWSVQSAITRLEVVVRSAHGVIHLRTHTRLLICASYYRLLKEVQRAFITPTFYFLL